MRKTMPDDALELEAPRSLASPLMALRESADLVMVWCDHSKPRFQALLAFARSEAFARRAALLDGREHADLGKVRWNG
jgi:putative molybdopterin biosynthesis protein